MDTFTGWQYSCPDGRRLIKQIQSAENIYSYDPMPDGKVTTISVKLISTTRFYDTIGFASALGRYNPCWVGCQKESFSLHLLSS
jgi:hypothetical protein